MSNITLILLKPDAIERGLTYQIIDRFINNDFAIKAMDLLYVREEQIRTHYAPHIALNGEEIAKRLIRFFVGRPAIPIILKNHDAITRSRALIGSSDPSSSPKGTIRGDWCDDSYELAEMERRSCRNLIHGSDSVEELHREIPIWLPTFDYKLCD